MDVQPLAPKAVPNRIQYVKWGTPVRLATEGDIHMTINCDEDYGQAFVSTTNLRNGKVTRHAYGVEVYPVDGGFVETKPED